MEREQPLYSVIAHPAAHLGAYAGLALLALLSIGAFALSVPIGLVLLAAAVLGLTLLELVRRADRLALYEDGVAREYKLLSTKRTFTEYESIQDMDVTQSVVERILGIGTIHINTSGSHGKEIVFRGIGRCHEVEAAIRYKMLPPSVDTGEPGRVR